MLSPRRSAPLLALLAFFGTLLLLRRRSATPVVGLIPGTFVLDEEELAEQMTEIQFVSGQAKPPGSTYTRALVVARMSVENVSWIDAEGIDVVQKIYVADDPHAPLHPPQNRGHEAMIYLTYIIDHYDTLPDISIFMHAHQWAWHNNDILNNDAAEMLRRLSSERVSREGYMNLRCHWLPGCPAWMHPAAPPTDSSKAEEAQLAQAWRELFPSTSTPVPPVLAAPCCAQFALSRARIRATPKSRYQFYRTWLLRTPLPDAVSGRIWEYLWHYVFTGQPVSCPDQHGCYCDGYGVCFDGQAGFEKWHEVRAERRAREARLARLREAGGDAGVQADLERSIAGLNAELDRRRWVALERGRDPRLRAESVGRAWVEGVDGF